MSPLTYIAIYFMIWWTCLFVVLPLWNKSHAEEGVDTVKGGDPGAPLKTNMKKKLIIKTIIATVIFAVAMIIIGFGLIPLPEFPG